MKIQSTQLSPFTLNFRHILLAFTANVLVPFQSFDLNYHSTILLYVVLPVYCTFGISCSVLRSIYLRSEELDCRTVWLWIVHPLRKKWSNPGNPHSPTNPRPPAEDPSPLWVDIPPVYTTPLPHRGCHQLPAGTSSRIFVLLYDTIWICIWTEGGNVTEMGWVRNWNTARTKIVMVNTGRLFQLLINRAPKLQF